MFADVHPEREIVEHDLLTTHHGYAMEVNQRVVGSGRATCLVRHKWLRQDAIPAPSRYHTRCGSGPWASCLLCSAGSVSSRLGENRFAGWRPPWHLAKQGRPDLWPLKTDCAENGPAGPCRLDHWASSA